MTLPPKGSWVHADFNGMLERDLLCVSHNDVEVDQAGNTIVLRAGLRMTVFDLDADEHGRPDDIVASGLVEPSPEYAQCRGSRWSLRIDEHGIRHESELQAARRGAGE